MSRPSALVSRTRAKAKRGEALNISELSRITGWGRSSLQEMHLPLIAGKIPLPDFRRILRQRQNHIEAHPLYVIKNPPEGDGQAGGGSTAIASFAAAGGSMSSAADKFRVPRSMCDQPAASRRRVESRAHSNA